MTSDSTRQKVLDAAGRIFAEKGYKDATVREICQRAGVNVASVNYYFGDKQRLYLEAVKQARLHRAAEVPLPWRPAGASPEVRLRDFVVTILTRMLGQSSAPWHVRLMLREVLHPTAACKTLVEEYFRPQFELLLGILDEILPPDTAAHTRRQIGFSVIGQCLFYRVAGEVVGMLTPEDEFARHYTPERLAEHIAGFCLASLGRTPPPGGETVSESGRGATAQGST